MVGTGGEALDALGTRKVNSEVFSNESFGVLKLTLQAAGYAWEFVPDGTSTFTDTGTTAYH